MIDGLLNIFKSPKLVELENIYDKLLHKGFRKEVKSVGHHRCLVYSKGSVLIQIQLSGTPENYAQLLGNNKLEFSDERIEQNDLDKCPYDKTENPNQYYYWLRNSLSSKVYHSLFLKSIHLYLTQEPESS